MHPQYDFVESSYRDIGLGEALRWGALGRLIALLLQKRVVPFAGAGVSMGLPSDVPSATAVSAKLVAFAEAAGKTSEVAALRNADDLGEVSELFEDHLGRDILERQLKSELALGGRPFNLGHLAIALAFAEGFVTVGFTTNWDPLISNAADTVAADELGAPCDVPSLRVAGQPMMVHLHGDIAHPATMVAGSRDLAAPAARMWTEPQLKAALGTGRLLPVGFGAEPEYVVETLKQVLAQIGDDPAAVIDFKSLSSFIADSPDLAAAAGVDNACTYYVEGAASEVLGEVLRLCYCQLADGLLDAAEQRAQALFPGRVGTAGVDRVRTTVRTAPLASFLGLMWRSAFVVSGDWRTRQPTVATVRDPLTAALAVVMTIASATDVEDLAQKGAGFRCTYAGGKTVDLWLALPHDRVTTNEAARATSTNSSYVSGPADSGVPLAVICARTDGFPVSGGHVSLVGTSSATSVAASARTPSDVLTLDALDQRVGTLASTKPWVVEDLVETS